MASKFTSAIVRLFHDPAERRRLQGPIIEVAIAIIVRDGEILVTRRKEGVHLPGLWEFPGGKRDSGETIRACLLREVKEELGATVEIERLFWERSHDYADRTVILHAYFCRLLSGDLMPLASQELKWIRPDSLLSLPFPEANRPLLEKLAKELSRDSLEKKG
ncbi:(deoxy)nucleoside triphosphate pyrophosphohydrolase [Nitrospiraceae bacterium HYJII51-Mn-bac16s-1-B09]|uniref:8-oxo-dGTP diphosphatase n=1 Tax=Candidatus Manganitrophus noduliformans TaxID=2606439 RepID=A0A7X6DLJ8_9BACT|nr:(deoxy)nucleoside triphosphate pyrophosphohydrolase [Candidatus Manganitrophus noduliformans]